MIPERPYCPPRDVPWFKPPFPNVFQQLFCWSEMHRMRLETGAACPLPARARICVAQTDLKLDLQSTGQRIFLQQNVAGMWLKYGVTAG
jgi:hypothetical protein